MSAGSSDGTRLFDPSQNEVRFILVRWNFIKQRAFGLNIPQTLEDICDHWSLRSATDAIPLPNPEPRALLEPFVMPSIRSGEIAPAQRSGVLHCENALKALDLGDSLLRVHFRFTIQHERGIRQFVKRGGIRMSCVRASE
jgi:hypothetical protein